MVMGRVGVALPEVSRGGHPHVLRGDRGILAVLLIAASISSGAILPATNGLSYC